MNETMSNKELIAAGHEFARHMGSDTPIIDIAKMVTRLASQLDVTTAALRQANAQLESQSLELKAAVAAEIEWEKSMMQAVGADGIADVVSAIEKLKADGAALAAENAYLLPKAASELSNAWVLHKYLIGIQAAIMYLDNGNKKAAQEWLYGTIAGPGFDFPDEVEDIEEWATHQMRGSISHPRALEIIKDETPATDAFIAEIQATKWREGNEPTEFGRYWVRYNTDVGPQYCSAKWMRHNFCAGSDTNIHNIWLADHSRSLNPLRGVTHYTKLPNSLELSQQLRDEVKS